MRFNYTRLTIVLYLDLSNFYCFWYCFEF